MREDRDGPYRIIAGAMAIAMMTAVPAAAQKGGPALAPHRAVYDMVLDKSRMSSGVTGVRGRMVYEMTGSRCDGWTQTMRFVTEMTGSDGQTSLNDLRSTTFEDDAASQFRFSSTTQRNQKTTETTNGEARREENGIKIDLKQPQRKSTSIAGRVYLPVEHSMALVTAAREGRTQLKADIYDGSEKGEKVYETSAIIGSRRAPGANGKLASAKGAEPLDALPAWPVTISYYERGKSGQDAVPVYELGFLYFDNGVSRRLTIDYGDFAIRGELTELTFLDAPKCDRK
jgi:hypothetical protein